ncbi:MAG: sigma-70 family RNA polymerase sigma factor [Acidobacteriaceae bacterium]|nr:sigma-70 family RNA polymerase sigma factor [Acidobacteriaceae bacterium]
MPEATERLNQAVMRTTQIRGVGAADSAFEAIFLDHYERVLGILLRLVGNLAQAEELANEVFWRLYRQPASWLLTSNVGGWLYRTATHAGIDALRASAHRKYYEKAAALDARHSKSRENGPLNDVLREEDRRRVQQVLSCMKPAQAQLLLMRASGSSYKELAAAFGIATGGVGTLLNRAEAEFRKRYLKLTGQKKENV